MEATTQAPGIKSAVPTYSILAIAWRSFWLSLLSFGAALLIVLPFLLARSPETAAAIEANAVPRPFWFRAVLVPMVETVLFQLATIELLLKVRVQRPIYLILAAAIVFIGIHVPDDKGLAVLPLGFVLAYSYWYWRTKTGTWRIAFAATWLTHGLHNFYSWLLQFVPASFLFG